MAFLLRNAAALLCAVALPLAAQANDVLTQVEQHCIQPGLDTAHFLTAPDGWTALAGDDLADALTHAAIPNALITATLQYGKRAGDTAYDATVRENLADRVDRTRADVADGQTVFLQHASGARLMVKLGNGGWSFLECMLWHPDADADLHAAIMSRWAVAAPFNLQTPYGFQNDTSVYISLNNQPAELNARIILPSAKLAPTPVILMLETRPL